MKYLITALALIALCAPAFAQDGDNTTVKAFLHVTQAAGPGVPTDNATVANEMPGAAATQTVDIYFGLTDLTTGFTVISFRLTDVVAGCPGVMATQSFVNLMPGNLAIGDPFDATGVTIASTECLLAPFQIVGYATCFYLGGACQMEILDHADYPRWVVDCNEPGRMNPYCVWKNAGVGTTAPAGDPGCDANVPVEDATWTSIKALYGS